MNTQLITLDFCQNDYRVVKVKQYDKDSRHLIITLADNGTVYKLNPLNHECRVKMITPDSRPIYNNAVINDDGTILITFTESMLYAGGTGQLEVQILEKQTEKIISSMILTIIIVNSVYPDDAIIASDEFNALTDALIELKNAIDKSEKIIILTTEIIEKMETLEASIEIAESERIEAENIRLSAESIRISNENERISAETKRQEDILSTMVEITEAIDRANKAAELCEELSGNGLPIADSETLGTVKIGDNITNNDGTISLTESNVLSALKISKYIGGDIVSDEEPESQEANTFWMQEY